VVQVGNPFMEKLLIEACMEVLRTGALVGLQDLGATGLTSATVESAGRGGSGVIVDVDRVPRRAGGMTPYEVMLSESQERMLAVVERGRESEVQAVFRKWGLHGDVIGRVSDGGQLQVQSGGAVVAELPVRMLVQAPAYERPVARPAYLARVQPLDPATIPVPADLAATFLALLASPNIASRRPVFRQFDHMVGTNTIGPPGGDAAVLRIKGTRKAIALSTDGNARICFLEPRAGGSIAVAEAARNVTCVGARPLAITNCLNFGSPQQEAPYYQLVECIDGMAEACRVLDTPVVSGNVSLYNETQGEAIWPTPIVGMLGLLEDASLRCDAAFKQSGDIVALLGRTEADLGGSEYLAHVHGVVAGRPAIDLRAEAALQDLCRALITDRLLHSAHDCSDGGLAVAVAECAFAGGVGAEVQGDRPDLRPDAALFAETQSRIVISVAPAAWPDVERRAQTARVPIVRLGTVGGERLRLGPFAVALAAAQQVWEGGMRDALAGDGRHG